MLRELTIEKKSVFTSAPPFGGQAIVLLRDKETNSAIPIFTGFHDAQSIYFAAEDVQMVRPQTHDLFKNTLVELGYMFSKAVITELRDNIYYASIYLEKDGHEVAIDARPSDSIALALRFSSPIFIEEKVFMLSLESDESKMVIDYLERIISGDESKPERHPEV